MKEDENSTSRLTGRRSAVDRERKQHKDQPYDYYTKQFNEYETDELSRAYNEGFEKGYDEGYERSYDEGYADGYNDGYGDHEYKRKSLNNDHPEDQRWHKRKSWSWYWL